MFSLMYDKRTYVNINTKLVYLNIILRNHFYSRKLIANFQTVIHQDINKRISAMSPPYLQLIKICQQLRVPKCL